MENQILKEIKKLLKRKYLGDKEKINEIKKLSLDTTDFEVANTTTLLSKGEKKGKLEISTKMNFLEGKLITHLYINEKLEGEHIQEYLDLEDFHYLLKTNTQTRFLKNGYLLLSEYLKINQNIPLY